MRSILRDASTGLIAIDPLGRVIYVNATAESILGLSAEAAVGADSLRVFRTMADGENVLLQGLSGDLPGNEVWVRRPDGKELPVELRLSQIRAADGQVLGVVGAFDDLSEIRGMQDRLRHRDRLATVGELAAGIAHEIGNPLTGIRGCAQILRDRVGEESQELVRVIVEEVDRLGRLAGQVGHYVRPNAPRMQRKPVTDCVDRVIELTVAAADEAGVSVHRDWPPDLPEIYHDPEQVEQVVMNLVQNAIEAMRGEGGRLTVHLQALRRRITVGPRRGRRSGDRYDVPHEIDREFVRVSVSDTGPGIAPDVLERIWNPFFTTKPDGLGLGLSLSQTIVQEHAGSLTAISTDGKGTTFILDLPVDRRAT
jgi:two-component system sensor histidine kinase HydH